MIKQNILFIHSFYNSQFQELYSYLRKKGENIFFLVQNTKKNREYEDDTNVFYFSSAEDLHKQECYISGVAERSSKASYEIYKTLRNLIIQKNIDIIVAHGSLSSPHLLFNNIDIPIITYIEHPSLMGRGNDIKYPPQEIQKIRDNNFEMLSFYEVLKSNATIVPTQYAKSLFPKDLQHKIKVQMEGFNIHRIDIRKEKSLLFKKKGITYIGFTARYLCSSKGFEKFMEVSKRVLNKRKDICFVVIGSSVSGSHGYDTLNLNGKTLKQSCIEKYNISKEELEENYVFYESIPYEDFSTLIYDIDFFLYPLQSGVANWGLFEILLRGKIIIASNRCFIPEVIKNGENGFMVDYDSNYEWEERINYVIDNREELINIEKNALALRKKYSLENMAEGYLSLIKKYGKKKKEYVLFLRSKDRIINDFSSILDPISTVSSSKILNAALSENLDIVLAAPEDVIQKNGKPYISECYFITNNTVTKMTEGFSPLSPLFISDIQALKDDSRYQSKSYLPSTNGNRIEALRDSFWSNTPKQTKKGLNFTKTFFGKCFNSFPEMQGKFPQTIDIEDKIKLSVAIREYINTQENGVLILKPSNESVSRGIQIITQNNIEQEILKMQESSYPSFVAQEFIFSKQYHKRSTGMRIMISLLSLNPLKFVVHKNSGGAFFGSQDFDKNSEQSIKNSVGNHEFITLEKYLQEVKVDENIFWNKIENIAQNSFLSFQKYFQEKEINMSNFATVFGVDFIIDENDNPYILEMNHMPGMTILSHIEDAQSINQSFSRAYQEFFRELKK